MRLGSWSVLKIILLFLGAPVAYNIIFTPSNTADYVASVSWSVPVDYRVSYSQLRCRGLWTLLTKSTARARLQ